MYKSDEESIGGLLIVIADQKMEEASPIMWKSKHIDRVCHSSKDAETLVLSKILDEAVYIAKQLEILLSGDYRKKIPVRIMTNNEQTLESIPSTRQI